MSDRSAGVLLHITSLPNRYGIGTLGEEAFSFVDNLVAMGQKIWQILPLGPVGAGNSPYQCLSAYAGDELFIDIDLLVKEGLLFVEEIPSVSFSDEEVEYEEVRAYKRKLLYIAYNRALSLGFKESESYHRFHDFHGWWLDTFSIFMAYREDRTEKHWNLWPEDIALRDETALCRLEEEYEYEIGFWQFTQYHFFKQWYQLKEYANSNGVNIFGDMPLYVSYDSADVWANRSQFILNSEGEPTEVGGVPPDYFSEDGQLWGNPLFDWNVMRNDNFGWWLARIHFSLNMFDILRIDHFRGLDQYWSIPADADTAKDGAWKDGCGDQLLAVLRYQIGSLPIVAEDLGEITESVVELRKRYNLPGMKVLQFAFLSDGSNEHLPHNHSEDFYVYSGTHDNDTAKGWLDSCSEEEMSSIASYLNVDSVDYLDILSLTYRSTGKSAIVPIQDILGLDSSHRFNTPGVAEGNWCWRMTEEMLSSIDCTKIKKMVQIFGR